jgi:hypothetical protein
MTKKHCVADCLAVLQVYRSDMQLVSLWGYVKKTGVFLAGKHAIKEGATMEQLRTLAQEYKIDIIFNVDKEDREAWD